MFCAIQRLHFQEFAVVEHRLDHLVHVVRLVGRVRDQRVERQVIVGDIKVADDRVHHRVVEIVRWQVPEQRLDVVDRVVLVGGQVVRVARLRVVGTRAAQLLHRDVLAGDRLDHVRAGDEHVRGLVDHDGEVGECRGVDGAARARAHDERDLRDHAGRADVAEEDLAVQAERDDALLDARAAGVVDADDRAAVPHRHVHHLDDLLAEYLAERAAEDREVLREHADRPAVDGAVPGHHAVAVWPGLGHAEVRRAVPGELVEFDERTLVEQHVDAFAGGLLAPGVLLFHGAGGAGMHRFVDPAAVDLRACRRWCGY